MTKLFSLFAVSITCLLITSQQVFARAINPADISVPQGYTIEAVVKDLAAPTMVTFDDQGRMIIAESGYGGSGEPKVSRVETDGTKVSLTNNGIFGNELPITAVTYYQGNLYVVHAGTVSLVQPDGTLKDIITGLPGLGDHQANQLVFHDGKMYVSIGTVTNSGVVGPDNAVFGWLTKPENKNLHDIPCQDIQVLGNAVFESESVAGHKLPKTKTAPYAPFGSTETLGKTVKGNVKCNGALLVANPDGTALEVYAWGFRNPYGLVVGPDNNLYVSMHGFDARGSRPIENAWDCLYKVEKGKWYGWPDFACDTPVTDPQFMTKDKPQPAFILTTHPTDSPPRPIAKFSPHAAANGFAFAPSGWGRPSDIFLALFGDFTPATGSLTEPQGIKVIKVDTDTGSVSDFLTNNIDGQASKHSAGGLEHPSSVAFGSDGNMYIADWGVANITVDGLTVDKESGVIWKVSQNQRNTLISFPSLILPGIFLILFFILAKVFGAGTSHIPALTYVRYGFVAGLSMAVVALIVSGVILHLPWYAPTNIFASMVMGRSALANILEFHWDAFIVGLLVLLMVTSFIGSGFALLGKSQGSKQLLSGVFYGLGIWTLLQYVIWPALFPIVVEKGFPPHWYAISFALYGAVLGYLSSYRQTPLTREVTEKVALQSRKSSAKKPRKLR